MMDESGGERAGVVARRTSEQNFTPSVALQGRNVMCTSTMIKVTYDKPVIESPRLFIERLAFLYCPRDSIIHVPASPPHQHNVERAPPPPDKPSAIRVSRETPHKAPLRPRPLEYYPFMLTATDSRIPNNKENEEGDGREQLINVENDGTKEKEIVKHDRRKQWIADSKAKEKQKRGRKSRKGEAPPEEAIAVQKAPGRKHVRKRKSKSEIILDEAIGITGETWTRKARSLTRELPELGPKSRKKPVLKLPVADLHAQKKRKATIKDMPHDKSKSKSNPRRSGRRRTASRFYDQESEPEDVNKEATVVPSHADSAETRRKSVRLPWQSVLTKTADMCENLHKDALGTRKSKRGKKRSRSDDNVTSTHRESEDEVSKEAPVVPSHPTSAETRRKAVRSPWSVLTKAADICENLHKEALVEGQTTAGTRKSKRGKKQSRSGEEDMYKEAPEVPSHADSSETRRKSVRSPWQFVVMKAVDCENLHKEALDEAQTPVGTRKSKRGKKRSRSGDGATSTPREKSGEMDSASTKKKEHGRHSRRHHRHQHKDQTHMLEEESTNHVAEPPRKRMRKHGESPGPPVEKEDTIAILSTFGAKPGSSVDVLPETSDIEACESPSPEGRKKRGPQGKGQNRKITKESAIVFDSAGTRRRTRVITAEIPPKNTYSEPGPKRRGRSAKLPISIDSSKVQVVPQALSPKTQKTRGSSKTPSKHVGRLLPDISIPNGEEYHTEHDQTEKSDEKKVKRRRGDVLKEQTTYPCKLSSRVKELKLTAIEDKSNNLEVCEENSIDDPLVAQMAQLENESVNKPRLEMPLPMQHVPSQLSETISESVTAKTSQVTRSQAPQPLVSEICPSLAAELPQQSVTELTLSVPPEQLHPSSPQVIHAIVTSRNEEIGALPSVNIGPSGLQLETAGATCVIGVSVPVKPEQSVLTDETNFGASALCNGQVLRASREQTPEISVDPSEKSTPPKKRGRRKFIVMPPAEKLSENMEIKIPPEIINDVSPPKNDMPVAVNTDLVCAEPPYVGLIEEEVKEKPKKGRGVGLNKKGKGKQVTVIEKVKDTEEVDSEPVEEIVCSQEVLTGVHTVEIDMNNVVEGDMFDAMMVVAAEEVIEGPCEDITVTEHLEDVIPLSETLAIEVPEVQGGVDEGEGSQEGQVRHVEKFQVEDFAVGEIRGVEEAEDINPHDIMGGHDGSHPLTSTDLSPEIFDENGLGKKPKKEKKKRKEKKKKEKKHKREKSTEPEKLEWAPLKVKNGSSGSSQTGAKDSRQLVVSLVKLKQPTLVNEKAQVVEKSDSGHRKTLKKHDLREKPKLAHEREKLKSVDGKEKPKTPSEAKEKPKLGKEREKPKLSDEVGKSISKEYRERPKLGDEESIILTARQKQPKEKIAVTKSSGLSLSQKHSKRLEDANDALVKKKDSEEVKSSIKKKHRHGAPEKEIPKLVNQEPPVQVSPIGTVAADRSKSVDEKPRTPKYEQPNNIIPAARPKTPKPEPFGLKSPRDRSVAAAPATPATPPLTKDSKGVTRIVQCVDMFSGLAKPQVRKERKEAKAVAKRPHVVVPSLFAPDPPAPATRPSRPSVST